MTDFITVVAESTGGYDLSGLTSGLQSGVDTLVTEFINMVSAMLPSVMPILAISVGLGFCIGLVRRFI